MVKPSLGIVLGMLVMFGTRTVLAASEPVRVAVDWSAISDATIDRCNLTGLQSLLLQTLIEAGYAVVDITDSRAIRVTIGEEAARFGVVGSFENARATRSVRLPQRCDGTIGIDLQSAVRAVADELRHVATPAPPPAPAPIVITQAPAPAPQPRLTLSVGGGVSGSTTSSLFAMPMVRASRWTRELYLAVQLDVATRSQHDVIVVEPVLSLSGGRRLVHSGAFAIAVGASAGLLGHVFTTDGDSGGHVDARFGVPVDVSYAMVTLTAMPTMRLRPVTYRTDDAIAYRADRFGLLVALAVSFDI